jgi:transcription factor WhiB
MVLWPRQHAPDWDLAKCAGMIETRDDEDPWFKDEQAALSFCNSESEPCPIREQCLIFALMNNCSTGVYGGMSELDRKALRKMYPLRRSYKVDGVTTWDPRPEWKWFPPGVPLAMAEMDAAQAREELDQEIASD